ncbi:MAG: hypothetical protein WBF33_26295 [Candidatus Nitrosopolaris sp.]
MATDGVKQDAKKGKNTENASINHYRGCKNLSIIGFIAYSD